MSRSRLLAYTLLVTCSDHVAVLAFRKPSFFSSPGKLDPSELVIPDNNEAVTLPLKGQQKNRPENAVDKKNPSESNINHNIISEDSLEIPSWVNSGPSQPKRKRRNGGFLSMVPRDGEFNVDMRSNSTDSWIAHDGAANMSLDAVSFTRLARLGVGGTVGLGSALVGTLRLLAPLVVARRGIYILLKQGQDWHMGRTIRTTVEHIEEQYYHEYEVPAALRSAARMMSHTACLFVLGRLMESLVGLAQSPCVSELGGCQSWCGLLWLVAVLGTGHACGAAIAVWGGPLLRLHVAANKSSSPPTLFSTSSSNTASSSPANKSSHLKGGLATLRRAKQLLLRWLRDPDQWIRDISKSHNSSKSQSSFYLDPLMFPATWEPLILLQMLVIATEMVSNRRIMSSLMRWVLLQQALRDEWYRVLLCEQRIGLGLLLSVGYLLATMRLFWECASGHDMSALLFLAPLCAVLISTWMNGFLYLEHNRRSSSSLSSSSGSSASSDDQANQKSDSSGVRNRRGDGFTAESAVDLGWRETVTDPSASLAKLLPTNGYR